MLTITSPPLKEVRELAQRSMCKGGMLIAKLPNHQIVKSPNRQIVKFANLFGTSYRLAPVVGKKGFSSNVSKLSVLKL